MAGGFRSPLPPLGTSGPAATVTGGYITLPWFQGGGSSGPSTGGYITLPWWQAGGGVGEDPEVDEQVRGGHRKHRRRVIHLNKHPELKELLPKDITETTRTAILEGKVDVEGTEVIVGQVPTPPVSTISASAPLVQDITDVLDREIAELIRTAEAVKLTQDFHEDVRKFEEEFLMFLILIMDC